MLKKDRVNWYCTNSSCLNEGMEIDVFHMISAPHCAICGRPMTLSFVGAEKPTMDPNPEREDVADVIDEALAEDPMITIPSLDHVTLYEPETFADVPSHYFDEAGQKISDEIDDEAMDAYVKGDDVVEWMRCRDGIDTAEIALKGFCQEIGANIIEGKVADICRQLQNLVHTHYGLGD